MGQYIRRDRVYVIVPSGYLFRYPTGTESGSAPRRAIAKCLQSPQQSGRGAAAVGQYIRRDRVYVIVPSGYLFLYPTGTGTSKGSRRPAASAPGQQVHHINEFAQPAADPAQEAQYGNDHGQHVAAPAQEGQYVNKHGHPVAVLAQEVQCASLDS